MEEKASKLPVKLIAMIAIVLGLVACLAVVLVKADVFAKPEDAVESALLSLSEEGTESSFESVFGLEELLKRAEEQGSELRAEISVSDIPGELFGMNGIVIPKAGIAGVVRADVKNDRQSVDLDLKLADTKFASLNMYVDKEQIQVALPQFFTAVLSVPYAAPDFATQLKNSYVGQMIGFTDEYWEMLEAGVHVGGSNRTFAKETEKLKAEFAKLQKKLYSGMEAKKNGTVTVAAAGDLKCKNYTAVFPEQLVKEVLEEGFTLSIDYLEKFWKEAGLEDRVNNAAANGATDVLTFDKIKADAREALDNLKKELQDVTLSLDLNGKRVIRLTLAAECQTKGTFTYEMLFAPEGHYQDNVTASLTKQGEAEPLFSMVHEAKNDKEQLSYEWEIVTKEAQLSVTGTYDKVSGDFQIAIVPEENSSVVLNGVVTETKKGEAIAAEIHSLTVSENGVKETTGLELSFSYRVLKSTVEPISSGAKNILEMKEDDWNALLMEVYGKLFGILGGFGGALN